MVLGFRDRHLVLLLSGSFLWGALPLPLLAQFSNPAPLSSPTFFSAPTPPSNLGEPGGRSEAASRGCSLDQEAITTNENEGVLTALASVVATDEFDAAVWGLTTADRPTFWFYVPGSMASRTAEFVLEDDANQWTYAVNLTEASGIVEISLPETSPPLTPEVDYHWYFNVYCQPEQPPFFVHGWIRKVEPSPALANELAQATPAQQLELYAANGIWYDALAIAANLRATNPSDPNWTRLLESVELGNVAENPLTNCCQTTSDHNTIHHQSQLPIKTYGDQYIGRQ
ncbi:MAG: DUF928 domain-containing protein [Elainellaceae cyanobacterium]